MLINVCNDYSAIDDVCLSSQWIELVTLGDSVDALYLALPSLVTLILVAFILKKAKLLTNNV